MTPALLLLLFVAQVDAEQGDWFARLPMGEGVELVRDERPIALGAFFDAAGFVEGEKRQSLPFVTYRYSGLRSEVREALRSAPRELLASSEQFVEGHPIVADDYLRVALSGKDDQALAGLGSIISKVSSAIELPRRASASFFAERARMRVYKAELAAPLAQLLGLLGAQRSQSIRLFFNPMDAPEAVRGFSNYPAAATVAFGPAATTRSILAKLAALHVAKLSSARPEEVALISEALAARALGQRDAGALASVFQPTKPFDKALSQALEMLRARPR